MTRLLLLLRRTAVSGFCCVLFLWSLAPMPALGDDLLDDDKRMADFIGDVRNAGEEWWNPEWKRRRKISITDLKLLNDAGVAMLLTEPDPLLMFNTGQVRDNLVDLRAVTADGHAVPCGVTHFGRDDGSSRIWMAPEAPMGSRSLTVYIYYDNPKAEASGDEFPTGGSLVADPQFVQVGAEQWAEGYTPPAPVVGSFFKNLAVLEAESCVPAAEADKAAVQRFDINAGAGRAVLMQKDLAKKLEKPIEAFGTVTLAEGGPWIVHVRYRNPNPTRKYQPFTVLLGGKEQTCGQRDAAADEFAWQSFTADLPAGETKVGFRLAGLCAPDCILFTKDATYRPDCRDISNPVVARFRVQEKNAAPFYIDYFSMFTTYSVNGQQGFTTGYLFKDRVVYPRNTQKPTDNGGVLYTSEIPTYMAAVTKDPKQLLQGGEWSPWNQAWPTGNWTWYSLPRFIKGGKENGLALNDVTVDYEFATRPDPSRVYRHGTEETGAGNSFNIHMPVNIDLNELRTEAITFREWGKRRFEVAQSMGFKSGEGPKKLVMATMAGATSAPEAEYVMKTLQWIGLNTISLGLQGTAKSTPELYERGGMTGYWNFFRTEYMALKYFYTLSKTEEDVTITGLRKPKQIPMPAPLPGLTADQTVDKILGETIDRYYRLNAEAAKKNSPWEFANQRYNDLDDEIGPAIDPRTINDHPLFHLQMVEYLKTNKLTPDFFGVKTWDDFKAFDKGEYSKNEMRLQQLEKDHDAATQRVDALMEGELTTEPGGGGAPATLADPVKDNQKEVDEKKRREKLGLEPLEKPKERTIYDKRAYTWTCKFQSYFTAMFYRHETAGVHKYWPRIDSTCANLQAAPIQAGRMWEGALNIFDLGRMNAFSALQVEDWHGATVNVGFGMNLMRAAARKKGQPLTGCVVGAMPGQRVVTYLANGTRNFLFYLYGPVYSIGPVWAEDKNTQRDLGMAMRQAARCEDDIYASKIRPADVALLVDNNSEISTLDYDARWDHDRLGIFAALKDAQIPVDVIGAEEVLEDNMLANYKVLYVCDSHVDSRVQAKIKAWVAAGGTLWADYTGLARQEYDQPSTVMDEVFGLKSRGPIVPYAFKGYNGNLSKGISFKVPKSELFSGEEITGQHYNVLPNEDLTYRPPYVVSTAKVLATFDDGKPAIIRNTYGKGQALLCGVLMGLSYGNQFNLRGYNIAYVRREAPATPRRGELITAIALAAGARRHVVTDRHMIAVDVHDGPTQSIVYITAGPKAEKDVPLAVTLPRAAKTAFQASTNKPLKMEMVGNVAKVKIDLAENGYDILVFK